VLRATTTPGGHPLIRVAWLAAIGLLVVGAILSFVARAGRPGTLVIAVGLVLLIAGYIAYLVRHLAFMRTLERAEAALDEGELERARVALAPLLERYTSVAAVQRAAGLATYALGDPLAASALLERAARSYRDDVKVAATLVASYAALNRGGDARRASALAPQAVDVRLALAWAELVALGGDRERGAAMVPELSERADVRRSASRRAMAAVLEAVAAARRADEAGLRAALTSASSERDALAAYERAFLGYLEGVALREIDLLEDARRAFEAAMEAAPGTIGEALARRERANMLAHVAAPDASAT
jgi:tetratricopeptide (TPR) repeat protein